MAGGGKASVRFSGDYVICPSGYFGGITIQMPTAIVRTYCADGFVIAADGMARDQDNKETSLTKRKIFPFGSDGSMAYSLAGRSMLGPDKGPEIWFNFRQRIDEAVQSVSRSRAGTLTRYAERLSKRIRRELTESCPSGKLPFDEAPSVHPGEIGCTVTDVFIDGYYKGRASSVMVRFSRRYRRFEGEVFTPGPDLSPGSVFHSGSTVIQNLIKEKDPRFYNDTYFRRLDMSSPHLSDDMLKSIIYSRAYIEACSSDEASALDPFCATIGGLIHMATVTPKDGFGWVPGFKSEEP